MLAASARRRASSEIAFALLELADQRVLLGARLQRGERARIEPVRQQAEIALRRDRHDGEDVVVQIALEREVERDRRRHRHGRREHRDRQARGQHARHRDHQQHDEQHEGARSCSPPTGWMRLNIQDSPKNRSSMMKRRRQGRMSTVRRLGQELPALGDDDDVDHQHRAGPDAGRDRADPQARQEADGRDQQQHHERGRKAVLREQPQQFVVEGGARAGGGGEPVARLAHALRRDAPPLGPRPPSVANVSWSLLTLMRFAVLARIIRANSGKFLKGRLKDGLNLVVNVRFSLRCRSIASAAKPMAALRRPSIEGYQRRRTSRRRYEALRRRPGAQSAAGTDLSGREGHPGSAGAGRSRQAWNRNPRRSPQSTRCSGCRRWCSTTAR